MIVLEQVKKNYQDFTLDCSGGSGRLRYWAGGAKRRRKEHCV